MYDNHKYNNDATLNKDYHSGFYLERMRVSANGKWGFIDQYGKEVIPLIYYYVEDFYEE
jgi:hypothetical protein